MGLSSEEKKSEIRILHRNEFLWQTWVVNAVGELIASFPYLPVSPQKKDIVEAISTYITQVLDGNINTLACEIGVYTTTIRAWQKGKMLPMFELLLRMCYCFRTSPVRFLTEKPMFAHSEKLNSAIWDKTSTKLKKERRKINPEKIRQELETILKNEEPPTPFRDIAKRLGYAESLLYRHCPELCHAISAKYLRYRKNRSMQKKQRLCEEVRLAAIKIHTQGQYPSSYRVGKLIRIPEFMLTPEAAVAWNNIVQELGWKNEEC